MIGNEVSLTFQRLMTWYIHNYCRNCKTREKQLRVRINSDEFIAEDICIFYGLFGGRVIYRTSHVPETDTIKICFIGKLTHFNQIEEIISRILIHETFHAVFSKWNIDGLIQSGFDELLSLAEKRGEIISEFGENPDFEIPRCVCLICGKPIPKEFCGKKVLCEIPFFKISNSVFHEECWNKEMEDTRTEARRILEMHTKIKRD
ncbi:MAG: hypothetical protein Q6364_03365 [Candidatus Hermodarchaeota archaeon]|nr:hypothetical protein [Candidatus Hermodarchaeota archaeon]